MAVLHLSDILFMYHGMMLRRGRGLERKAGGRMYPPVLIDPAVLELLFLFFRACGNGLAKIFRQTAFLSGF